MPGTFQTLDTTRIQAWSMKRFSAFLSNPSEILVGSATAWPTHSKGYTSNAPSQIQVNFLIDSGATASLLDEKVFECIQEHRPRLRPVDVRVTLADGSVQQCRGKATFPMGIGDLCQPVEFLVGRWSDQAILGMRELHMLGLSINFDGMVVTKDDWWIPTNDHKGQ